jgi:hypothetical protein
MKMLIKSNKGYSNISPLQNIIQDDVLEEVAYEDDEKCELQNGLSLLRTVTILVGMHSLATMRNVSVKVLHISSTSAESESNAFQSTVSSLYDRLSWSVRSYNHTSIEKPTRVTEHSSTLLDPIIISDYVHYSFSDVLKVPSDISDHDASIIFIDCPKFQTRSFQTRLKLATNYAQMTIQCIECAITEIYLLLVARNL